MKSIVTSLLALCLIHAGFTACSAQQKLNVEVDDAAIEATAGMPPVSYADVLEKATPSVVSVYTSRIVTSARTGTQYPLELYRYFGIPVPENLQQAPAERREELGVGSGVILSYDGYIVTNAHVVLSMRGEAADEILVRLSDGEEYVADLIGADQKTDVAVLKIDVAHELDALILADSDTLRVGDIVFAIGNPLDVGLTATQGIVSATGRTSFGILGPGGYENFIQTDAAINLGNSGGALIDAWGRLIGINTAIVSKSGGSNGIGFAIPVNMALNVMTSLIEIGEVPRGMLGLIPEDLSRDMAEAFGLDSTRGALVNQVLPDTPAEVAGIRHGDVIVRIDGHAIESAAQLRLIVSQTLPGTQVLVELLRQGDLIKLEVTLGSLSGATVPSVSLQDIMEGVTFKELDAQIREEASIPEEITGIYISEIEPSSPYADDLAVGMVIMEVNRKPVETLSKLKEHLQTGANTFYVWFRGVKSFIGFRLQ